MRDALGQATILVRDSEKRRAYPARKVSASDSASGRPRSFSGRTPVRKKVIRSQNLGRVWATPYYTNARTKAIKALYTSFGRRSQLSRKGLRVYRPWVKLSQLVFVEYAKDKKLKRWAIDRKMMEHHKIRVEDPRILAALLPVPALKRTRKAVSRLWRGAFIVAGAKY